MMSEPVIMSREDWESFEQQLTSANEVIASLEKILSDVDSEIEELKKRLETIFQYSRSCKASGLPMEHGRIFALTKVIPSEIKSKQEQRRN
jgi:predicted RNase H-like nuclease (RuvC/YqgF family)